MSKHIAYTGSLVSRMALVSSYNQVLASNHLPLWFKHKCLKHIGVFLYDRDALYIHMQLVKVGDTIVFFSPKLIQKNWSLYVHGL